MSTRVRLVTPRARGISGEFYAQTSLPAQKDATRYIDIRVAAIRPEITRPD